MCEAQSAEPYEICTYEERSAKSILKTYRRTHRHAGPVEELSQDE